MISITDDPLRDFDNYDAEMTRQEARLPKCDVCGEYIHDDIYFDIGGDILCEECVHRKYARSTEDYLNDN